MQYDDRFWVKSYDPSISPDVEIPNRSVTDRFDEIVAKFPHSAALHFIGLELTYEELMAHVNRFTQAVICNGCASGDVVAIGLPNIPQYIIALFGALKAGCVASGVSPLLTAPELAFQLKDSGAKVLVTLDAIFEHRLAGVADELPDLKLVITTGVLDFLPIYKRVIGRFIKKVPHGKVQPLREKKLTRFMDILRSYSAHPSNVKVQPDDHCLLQYTGGTTGVPKGTILTHRNIVANLVQVEAWIKPRHGSEVILSGFPFFHLAGLILGLAAIWVGGDQILIPNPRDTKHIVKEISKHKPTILVNVPSLYMMLLDTPGFRILDFPRLSFALSGAAPIPEEAVRELETVIGEGKLLEVYGMTESSPILTMNPHLGKKKVGTVGLPVPGTWVRLMDLETGREQVPVGTEGEIVASGPQIMKCYLKRPDETAVALREHDGRIWLHTGDVGRMDEDGFITIVDRAKDMLSVGGFKVFSRELEEKLYQLPAIEFCAIIGIPNPKRPGSEVVKLVLQPSQAFKERDKDELKADILAFARENFAPYKVPKIIDIIDSMPMTPVGKVDKKALRRTVEAPTT